MKISLSQIWSILILMLFLTSCLDPPEYSDIPKIKFEKLEFIEVADDAVNRRSDSLKLTFKFEDGTGDIGLTDNDNWGPYSAFFYVVYYDSTREYINNGSVIKGGFFPVTFSDTLASAPFYLASDEGVYKDVFSETDNRPELNCKDYYWEYDLTTKVSSDTFFVSLNEYHSNLHLKFFKKRNGTYFETSISEELNIDDCNQVIEILRIPVFDADRLGKPTIGSITYTYLSNGIIPFLAQDTFKLQFYVYDRQFNQSNIVDTPDFLLSNIARN